MGSSENKMSNIFSAIKSPNLSEKLEKETTNRNLNQINSMKNLRDIEQKKLEP